MKFVGNKIIINKDIIKCKVKLYQDVKIFAILNNYGFMTSGCRDFGFKYIYINLDSKMYWCDDNDNIFDTIMNDFEEVNHCDLLDIIKGHYEIIK